MRRLCCQEGGVGEPMMLGVGCETWRATGAAGRAERPRLTFMLGSELRRGARARGPGAPASYGSITLSQMIVAYVLLV